MKFNAQDLEAPKRSETQTQGLAGLKMHVDTLAEGERHLRTLRDSQMLSARRHRVVATTRRGHVDTRSGATVKTHQVLQQVFRAFVLSVFAMVSNGADTCEVARCRFDDDCWRPLCPYRHSGRGRAAMWARVWLTLAAAETERLASQESTWRQEPEGEAEVPKIIIVSCAVRGTKVDLDGKGLQVDEQIVNVPVPQIAVKIPEVVETIRQEHTSDDLPVPQVVKENLEVIKVPQEREDVPHLPEETVKLVKLVSQERGQQRTAEVPMPHSEEESVAVVTLAPRERVQHRTAEQIEDIPRQVTKCQKTSSLLFCKSACVTVSLLAT